MALFEQVSKDIMSAMKAKDKIRLEALRNIKKYFIEAKTAPGNNDELSDDEALKILAKLAKQGRESAALFKEKGREELASEELAQAEVIESYLPKALTEEEITAKLEEDGHQKYADYAQYETAPTFYTFDDLDKSKIDVCSIAKYIVEQRMDPMTQAEYIRRLWNDGDENILRLFFGRIFL
jgi:uncharacterized protein YqeY